MLSDEIVRTGTGIYTVLELNLKAIRNRDCGVGDSAFLQVSTCYLSMLLYFFHQWTNMDPNIPPREIAFLLNQGLFFYLKLSFCRFFNDMSVKLAVFF